MGSDEMLTSRARLESQLAQAGNNLQKATRGKHGPRKETESAGEAIDWKVDDGVVVGEG